MDFLGTAWRNVWVFAVDRDIWSGPSSMSFWALVVCRPSLGDAAAICFCWNTLNGNRDEMYILTVRSSVCRFRPHMPHAPQLVQTRLLQMLMFELDPCISIYAICCTAQTLDLLFSIGDRSCTDQIFNQNGHAVDPRRSHWFLFYILMLIPAAGIKVRCVTFSKRINKTLKKTCFFLFLLTLDLFFFVFLLLQIL